MVLSLPHAVVHLRHRFLNLLLLLPDDCAQLCYFLPGLRTKL